MTSEQAVRARLERAAARGDDRRRCLAAAHLSCEDCDLCACMNRDGELDSTSYPDGKADVKTTRQGTFCRECRYLRGQG